jgi:hypothetical protein
MEKLFSNSTLLIPSRLYEAVLREGFRPERQTAIYLVYDVIVQRCTQMKGKWTYIPDRHFQNVVKNHTRKSAEKHWLEKNGFIQIKKWIASDGTVKNSRIPGKKCQAYRVVEQGEECIWVDLWKRKLDWPALTWNDPFCQYTRKVLGTIEVDESHVSLIVGGEAGFSTLPHTRRMSIAHWARTLHSGAGRISRGPTVNRLFSPWTCSPRELRRACFLSGQPIVSIDLQASQPTLIGLLAEDDTFSQACFSDELYGQVSKLFAVNREEAKRIFLSYIYGDNRKARARNKGALRVQEYVAEQFPKTHAYVWKCKLHDYTSFSRQLQNLEAELFINGIMAEMMQQGIPVLTVHDSISVPAKHEQQALEISRKILGQTMRGKVRLKINQYGEEENEYTISI